MLKIIRLRLKKDRFWGKY